jgi:hypothetical protein
VLSKKAFRAMKTRRPMKARRKIPEKSDTRKQSKKFPAKIT